LVAAYVDVNKIVIMVKIPRFTKAIVV
jgi:hypothetical protein